MKFFKLDNGRYLGFNGSVSDSIIATMPELIEHELLDTSYEKTYSEEEYQLAVNPPTPTWENTLTCHDERSSSYELMELAHQLGYTYFTFNERVAIVTNFHQNLKYEEVEAVYEIDIK